MADEWDPFADPAEGGEAAGEEPQPPGGPAAEPAPAPEEAPDLDLLQPWELEQVDQGTLDRAEAAKARAKQKRELNLPSVADLERELAVLSEPLTAATIPAALGPVRPAPKLTKEQAVALEDALIAAYRTEDFQRRLHEAWAAAGGDPMLQGRARQEVCLPVQVPIVVQFGFEASKRGVTQSVNAFTPLNGEPEVAERNGILAWLVNPSLQAGIVQPTGRRLKPSEELVDRALEGDAGEVRRLLAQGADPNTIVLREERLKGSDGCCSCTITSEEYTPLIAGCMFHHAEVIHMLLEHPATDVNVVCNGINQEFGPYKAFSALDMARRFLRDSPFVPWLEGLGARVAQDLPAPPWPRPESEGTPEPPIKPKPPVLPPVDESRREAALPAAEAGSGEEVERVTRGLVEAMREHRGDAPEERSRLFKQLMLEWHPDKRPEADSETATAVCQWLNGPARCFLGGG